MNKLVKGMKNPRRAIQYLHNTLGITIKKLKEIISVRSDVRTISSKDKVLFVDLGSNVGQGYSWFKKYYCLKNIEFELFEPNPHCCAILRSMPDVKRGLANLNEVGVGVQNGEFEFYGLSKDQGGLLSQGGSINKSHNSNWYDASSESCISVKIISFSDYIESQIESFDKIIVKMDIEGAELDILEQIIENDVISHLDILYVEFHSHFQKLPEREVNLKREKNIIEFLSKKTDLRFRIWH